MLKAQPLRLIAVAGLAACVLLVLTSSSFGGVTIGNDLSLTPSDNACSNTVLCTGFGTEVVPSLQQTSPIDGVVVQWRLKASSVNNGAVALRVLHADALLSTFAHGTSETRTSVAGTNVFPTRLPINVGDSVGIDNATAGIYYAIGSGQNIHMYDTPLVDSAPARTPDRNGTDILLLNADIEADADHDGYGDETQDACPTDATTHGPCPVPDTPQIADTSSPMVSLASSSSKLSKHGAISFTITSNESAKGSVTGSVIAPGSSKIAKFNTSVLSLTALVPAKVSIKLSKKSTTAVRAALKKHKLKANLSISVSDAAGNQTAKSASLRLKP